LKRRPDCEVQLDEKLTFLNTEVKKEDYVSKRLPYELEEGDYSAWDKLVGRLYSPEEREKIEWAIGAVVSGDSKKIQKFCVFYGDPGTGKGTIIDIIQKLFPGYYTTFNARALGSSSNQFATEVFRSNPLVAIQHDGDLSRIEDNTQLNSIISHEEMVINEKGKSQYTSKMNCFLFMGTNRPVKITDAKSGIIRRLIDR
jgi:phage/plasmid-associated DNA primase